MKKLSPAQQRFLDVLDGKNCFLRWPEKDGTVMPFEGEARTVEILVKLGLIKWVDCGKGGYTYNGVVRVGHVPR